MSDFLESLLNNPAITNAMWPAFLETLLMVGIFVAAGLGIFYAEWVVGQ